MSRLSGGRPAALVRLSLTLAALAAACVVSRVALAQDAAGGAAASSPSLAWIGFAGLVVHAVMSILAPGTVGPYALSAQARLWVNAALSSASGGLSLMLSGSNAQTATYTALGTFFAALVAHSPQLGAKAAAAATKVAAAIALLCGLGAGSAACTKQEVASGVGAVEQALSAGEQACVDAELFVAAVGGQPTPAAADLRAACGLVNATDTAIQAGVAAWNAQPAAKAALAAARRK